MTSGTDYTTVARDAQSAFAAGIETWKQGLTSLAGPFSAFPAMGSLPQLDATEAVERYFGLVKQIVDLNHDYARSLAGAANELTGLLRTSFESLGGVARDQLETVAGVASSAVDRVEQVTRQQAEAAEEAERQQRKDVAKAQRERQKKAHDEARARYEDLTKAELSEQLSSRDLPKSGNVDELIERLIEDDTK